MSAMFVSRGVWPRITKATRQSRQRCAVAVAYFGQGGASLLPLRDGSSLVVDASEAAVKSGQTCPQELKKLLGKGVRIFTVPNLHAKVFVLGKKAFVGSANVSKRSAEWLVEAMVETTEPKAVAAARGFVRDLCVQELGPKAIDRLARIYRPPRIAGAPGARNQKGKLRGTHELPRVFMTQLDVGEIPEGSESVYEAGMRVAAQRQKKRVKYQIDDFWRHGDRVFKSGDMVVQVLDEGGGRLMVHPPGTVLHTRKWRRGRKSATFVYLEVPTRRCVALPDLAKRLGTGAKKRLLREGKVSRDFAGELLDYWKD
jgi:hypothetical protein